MPRSINDIANALRSIRVYLEPVEPLTATQAAVDDTESLGVPLYSIPNVDAPAAWYRVLGQEDVIDCNSSIFIYARLPDLTPFPICELNNTGYLDFPQDAKIPFVQLNWGADVIQEGFPKPPGHSTLSIDNRTGVDLWLIWTGDAHSKDFVRNNHASKHGGGNAFSANFLISVYKNNNGSVGDFIGNAAVNVHGADAGELVVRNNFCVLVLASQVIQIGLLIT